MMKKDFFDIDRIAFIGRTYDEYMSLFGLSESDLRQGPILDCGAGPSSFTAEAAGFGFNVTACDALYSLPLHQLEKKGREDIAYVFKEFDKVSHLYSWKFYGNKEEVVAFRKKALNLFVTDFEKGSQEGRYRFGELPTLPFQDSSFPLILVSHFLFLYGGRLSPDFHRECLRELIRICSGEIRIYPLTGLDTKPYPYLEEISAFLASCGVSIDISEVPFEFQRGSKGMMKVSCT